MNRQTRSSNMSTNGQQASTSSSFQSYRTEELQQAKDVLRTLMDVTPYSFLKRKLMTSDCDRHLHQSLPNKWEGEDGMMSHIQQAFPLPEVGMPDEKLLYIPVKPKPEFTRSAVETEKKEIIDLTGSPLGKDGEKKESLEGSSDAPIWINDSPVSSRTTRTPGKDEGRREAGKSVNVDSQIIIDSTEYTKHESSVSSISTVNDNISNLNEKLNASDSLLHNTSQSVSTKTSDASLLSVSDMSVMEPNGSGCSSVQSSKSEQDHQLSLLVGEALAVKRKVQALVSQIKNSNMGKNERSPKEKESLKNKWGRLIFLGTLIKELIPKAAACLQAHNNSSATNDMKARSINRLMLRIVKVYMKTVHANAAFLQNHLHLSNIRSLDVHWQRPAKRMNGEPATESAVSFSGSPLTLTVPSFTTSLFETSAHGLCREKLFWWRVSKVYEHIVNVRADLEKASRLLEKESQLPEGDCGISQGLQLCFKVEENYMQIKNSIGHLNREKKQHKYKNKPSFKLTEMMQMKSHGFKRVPGGLKGLQTMTGQLKNLLNRFVEGRGKKKKKKAKKDNLTKPAAQCEEKSKSNYSPVYEQLGIRGVLG